MKEQTMVITTYSDEWLNDGFKPLYFFDDHNEPAKINYISFPFSEFNGAGPGDGWLDVIIRGKCYSVDGGCLEKYEQFISTFHPDFNNQNSIKEAFEKHIKIVDKIEEIRKYLWIELKGIGTKKFLKEHLIEALEKIFNSTIEKLVELNEDIPYYDEKRFYHQKYEGDIKSLSPSFKINRKDGKRNIILNDDAKTVLTLVHTRQDLITDYIFNEW